jgi:hypothetical protein
MVLPTMISHIVTDMVFFFVFFILMQCTHIGSCIHYNQPIIIEHKIMVIFTNYFYQNHIIISEILLF